MLLAVAGVLGSRFGIFVSQTSAWLRQRFPRTILAAEQLVQQSTTTHS